MEVEILKNGKYAKFTADHIGRQTLKAGTLIEYPDWYGQSLIEMDRAKKHTRALTVEEAEGDDSAREADVVSARAETGRDDTPEEPIETTIQVTVTDAEGVKQVEEKPLIAPESPREKAMVAQRVEEKGQEAAFRRKRR